MLEKDILHTAIENLESLTLASISIDHQLPKEFLKKWDASITIEHEGIKEQFNVEVRGEVHNANLAGILRQMNGSGLLVARYISEPGKEILRKKNINYLDLAGNCFIRTNKGLHWYFIGQQVREVRKTLKHRAFQKNGIKLIFTLLICPELLNQTYREMADKANISASTVGDILDNLFDLKFLLKENNKKRILHNKELLLKRWVIYFNDRLKPKLTRGKFRFAKREDQLHWQNIDLPNGTYWGGEPAGDLYTNFLSPGVWTIYTPLRKNEIIQKLRLLPDPKGVVEVFEPFWSESFKDAVIFNKVHPLLVYADLQGTKDSRNFETAEKLYEQEIKNFL